MTLVIEEEAVESLPISVNPQVMGGTPVFQGTRVPIEALLENLAAGISLNEFLENFPTVSQEQALAILNFSNQTLKKLDWYGENPAR